MITKETKVLVVDDFELFRNVIKNVLVDLGFESIVEATNGEEALKVLKESSQSDNPVKLVFLDWNMPGVQGIDVLNTVKTEDDLSDTKVIMVTAEGEKSQVLTAFNAGVDDYIVKPCNKEIIEKKLNSLIERSKKKAG